MPEYADIHELLPFATRAMLCALHNGDDAPVLNLLPMLFLNVTLTVFAAASLHGAMPDIGQAFVAAHPGVSVAFDFDGSQVLLAQLKQGAKADVFASADLKSMTAAIDAGVVAGPATTFAHNSLTIVTPIASSVTTAADLGSPNVKTAICVASAPCGRYALDALRAMNISAHIVTQEINVEGVMQKVALNEVDAGIVYASDAVAAKPGTVRTIPIPPANQKPVTYPAAVVKGSANADIAAQFVVFLTSDQAQAILRKFGFIGAG